jgi:FixJ family two-component response regulator
MVTARFITVVDDDQSVRESLLSLLTSIGFSVETFSSAEVFLTSNRVRETECLILDVRMPGMSGPQLQAELARRGQEPPIVYISSYAFDDVWRHVLPRARVTYLTKPFSEAALLQAIDQLLPAR